MFAKLAAMVLTASCLASAGPAAAQTVQPQGVAAWQAGNPIGAALRDLQSRGVSLNLDYITDTATNPTGGVRRGTENSGWVDAGVDLDLDKLAGIPDTRAHVQAAHFYGVSLSQVAIGN